MAHPSPIRVVHIGKLMKSQKSPSSHTNEASPSSQPLPAVTTAPPPKKLGLRARAKIAFVSLIKKKPSHTNRPVNQAAFGGPDTDIETNTKSYDPPTSNRIWSKLKTTLQKMTFTYVNDPLLESNDSGVKCLAPAISVRIDSAATLIHANRIRLPELEDTKSDAGITSTKTYIAGQSPQPSQRPLPSPGADAATATIQPNRNYDNVLVHGIESGQGIFEFVTRKVQAHGQNANGSDSLLHQLLLRMDSAPDAQQPMLGNRYQVVTFEPAANEEGTDHSCYLLTVQDMQQAPDPATGRHPTITIPVTQAGLRFQNRVLNAPEIARAKSILDRHLGLRPETAKKKFEPTILSYAGVGRNATLIIYDAISTLIANATINSRTSLDEKLIPMIDAGRAQRGPQFIQSEAQLAALRAALCTELQKAKSTKKDRILDELAADLRLLAAVENSSITAEQLATFNTTLAAMREADTFSTFAPGQTIRAFDVLQKPLPPRTGKKPPPTWGPFENDSHNILFNLNQELMDRLQKCNVYPTCTGGGSTSLLSSMLQHATGSFNEAAPRPELAKLLHAIIQGKPIDAAGDADQWALEKINALFGRDLKLYLLHASREKNKARSPLRARLQSMTDKGTEPMVIWEGIGHAEAIYWADRPPVA